MISHVIFIYSPVIDALADLDVKEKYGSITKSVDFIPSEQAEGLYESKTVPTRIGSYSLIMNGTIQGEKVSNIEMPLDIVEATQKISFPDASTSNMVTSGTQSASNNIGPKLQTIISGMSNDVQSSKADIQSLAKNMGNIQKWISDIKSSVDRSYMIAMVEYWCRSYWHYNSGCIAIPQRSILVFTKFSAILGIIRTMDEIGTWLINGPFNPIKNMVSDCILE